MDNDELYYCALVSNDVDKSGEIYFKSNGMTVDPSGALIAPLGPKQGLFIAPGKWFAVFSASVIDGGYTTVEINPSLK